jgi:hypothetical protein
MGYKEIERECAKLNEWDEEYEGIRLPYSLALLFLYKYSKVIEPVLDTYAQSELHDIIDWIENGDPNKEDD